MPAHGFVERGEQSQAGIDGNRHTDGVDRWELTCARRVDTDCYRGARAHPVVVGVDMRLATIERDTRRHQFELRVDATVQVLMELSADRVEGQSEHQQPAREQPSAAHDAGTAT